MPFKNLLLLTSEVTIFWIIQAFWFCSSIKNSVQDIEKSKHAFCGLSLCATISADWFVQKQ